MKRVAVKYCGGCNPAYDRVELVRRIQDLAGERIQWAQIGNQGFDTVLLISGCDRTCAETRDRVEKGWEVVSIRDGEQLPEEIVALLMNMGNEYDQH